MIETTCLHWKDQYIEQGKKEGKKDVARKLAAINMDEDQIMSLTDLSREDVQRVMAEALAM